MDILRDQFVKFELECMHKRQEMLLDRYGFVCKCNKCMSGK